MDPRTSRSPEKTRRSSITHPPPTAYEHPPPHGRGQVIPLATMPIGEADDDMYKRRYLAMKPIVYELEDENNLIAYKIKILTPRIRQLEEELKAKKEAVEKKRSERPHQSKLWKAPHPSPSTHGATPGIKMDPGEWAALEKVHAGTHGYYSSDEEDIVPLSGPTKKGAAKNGKGGKRKSAVEDAQAMDVDMDSMRDSREGTRRSMEDEDEEIDDY